VVREAKRKILTLIVDGAMFYEVVGPVLGTKNTRLFGGDHDRFGEESHKTLT